jgi:ketosteroid isomerase-like protein
VWHNDDGVEIPAITAFEGARRLRELVDDLRVEVVRELTIEGGLVAQFELTGTVKVSGANLRARNCVFLFEQDGVLQRIEEYVDSTFGAQLGV